MLRLANIMTRNVVTAADILAFAASQRARATAPDIGNWTGPPADDEIASEVLPSASYFTQLWSDASDAMSDRLENPDGAELDLLDEHSVDEIMSRPLVMLTPAGSSDGDPFDVACAGDHNSPRG